MNLNITKKIKSMFCFIDTVIKIFPFFGMVISIFGMSESTISNNVCETLFHGFLLIFFCLFVLLDKLDKKQKDDK